MFLNHALRHNLMPADFKELTSLTGWFGFRPYSGIVGVNGTLEITVYIGVIVNVLAVTALQLQYLEI